MARKTNEGRRIWGDKMGGAEGTSRRVRSHDVDGEHSVGV